MAGGRCRAEIRDPEGIVRRDGGLERDLSYMVVGLRCSERGLVSFCSGNMYRLRREGGTIQLAADRGPHKHLILFMVRIFRRI